MSIKIETKYLDRRGWPRVTERAFAWKELDTPELRGAAGLIRIKKVEAPLRVDNWGSPLVIVDNGYDWLSVAPAGEHWWLTAMFDRSGEPFQYYFDVTRENLIRGGQSCFEDLMLDVVLTDGTCRLLDADELDAALAAGHITPSERQTALRTAHTLLDGLPRRAEELRDFCVRTRRELLRGL